MKIELSKEEKELIKALLKQELKRFEKKETEILTENPPLLAIEEKYDEFLKKVLKKLK
ncbi:hypothetical protein KY331_05730 [Candidatus Woesearchaeota archaeon]|nr:hypothetical protein [Candidatus Woesearchaeota archaeon]